jgi:hypothetical protein
MFSEKRLGDLEKPEQVGKEVFRPEQVDFRYIIHG